MSFLRLKDRKKNDWAQIITCVRNWFFSVQGKMRITLEQFLTSFTNVTTVSRVSLERSIYVGSKQVLDFPEASLVYF